MKKIFLLSLVICGFLSDQANAQISIVRAPDGTNCDRAEFTLLIPYAEQNIQQLGDMIGVVPKDYLMSGVYYSPKKKDCMQLTYYMSRTLYNPQTALQQCESVAADTVGRNGNIGVCRWINEPKPAGAYLLTPGSPQQYVWGSDGRCYSKHRVSVIREFVNLCPGGQNYCWGSYRGYWSGGPEGVGPLIEMWSAPAIQTNINSCKPTQGVPQRAGRYQLDNGFSLADEVVGDNVTSWSYRGYPRTTPPSGAVGFRFEVRCTTQVSNCTRGR